MKRYTPEELRTKTLSELRLLRAETLKKYQALVSFKSSAEAAILPVVYMILKSDDPPLYAVRTARSAMDLPGFKSHDDDDYGERLAYAQLKNPFITNDRLTEIAEKLKEALAPRKKQLPDSDEYAYEMPFIKVRHWVDVVSAWNEQEQNENAARIYEFRRKVAAKLKRAQKEDDDDDTDDDDSEPDLSVPINDAAAAAEKAKKQEMKKIAQFLKERLVPQDEEEPPLPKDAILSMYRIWARGTSAQSSALIVECMRTGFSAQPVYISTCDNALAFKGFALKTDDWVYVAPNHDAVNVFLREQCVFSPGVKSFSRTIQEAYVDWYGESDYPKTKRAPELKREVRAILDNCSILFPTIVEIKYTNTCGWYGVALRDDPDAKETPEKKSAVLNKATIVERRMPGPNGQLLESWPSLSKAHESLKIGLFKLKSLIAKKTPDKDGAILVCANAGAAASTSSANTPK